MIVVQVEGNIGAGKSTVINYLEKKLYDNDARTKHLRMKFITEPLHNWMNIVDNNCNLFDLYYKNPKEYAETFQTVTFGTTLANNLKCNFENIDVIFMERSLYTNVHCFVKLIEDQKYVKPIFVKALNSLLEIFKEKIIHPDIVIYLKTDDITILQERILKRGRTAEKDISKEYLTNLNDIYNNVIENHEYFNKSKKYIIPIRMTKDDEDGVTTKYIDNTIIKDIIKIIQK